MEHVPLPRLVPRVPDPEVERRVAAALYGDGELERPQPPTWLGALLLIEAFFFGGLAYALLLRACS